MDYQRIKNLAAKKKIPIIHLAENIGITASSLHWMIREKKMPVEVLEKIAFALGEPVTYFFDTTVQNINLKDSINANNLNESSVSYQKNFFSPEEQKLREENSRLMVENAKLRQEVSTLKDKIIKLLESKV